MHTLTKLVALAVLTAGTALISATTPSAAQAERQNYGSSPAECCSPEQKTFGTSAAWTVQPPSGPTIQAVPITTPNVGWHAALPGSQWIGPSANAGTAYGPAGGNYVYSFHFCLCDVPPKLSQFPAALSLSILADNTFVATLNGNQIGQNTSQYSFHNPTAISNVPANYFRPCDNVLAITVNNLPNSPTGLDVAVSLSAYFKPVPAGAKCPCGPRIPYQ